MRLALLALCCSALLAETPRRQVAITIDDLPLGAAGANGCRFEPLKAMTEKLLAPFRAGKLAVTGFVIGNACGQMPPAQRRLILEMWLDAGAELGNHTWSHPDLNTLSLERYQEDILKGDAATRPISAARGKPFRFFRHPFLHAGPDHNTKEGLERFLSSHNYRVAPVTLDNSDWMFAAIYQHALDRRDGTMATRVKDAYVPYMESIAAFFEQRSVEVAGHEIAQILLIHANQLNADCMPDLLEMLHRRGYSVIGLERALEDPAYSLPEHYAGAGGFSWIHRWSITRGLKPMGEPDEPSFIRESYRRLQRVR